MANPRFFRKISRFCGHHRGLRRVSEYLLRIYSGSDKIQIIRDFDGDLEFNCRLNSHISAQIFWFGYYSGAQLLLLNRILKPEMTFFDIGANEGEHTLFSAKRLTSGKVFSFEPSSENNARLVENVGRNRFKNIFVEKKGLSDRKGILPLYGSDSKDQLGAKNQGLPTLHPRPGVDRPLEEIELFRLDDYVRDLNLEKIDVIKIDVEGSELAVLKGAIEVLKKFRPLIFLEVSKETSEAAQYTTSDLINYVTAQGYRFEAILEGGRTRPWTANDGVPPRDMLCIPTEH